MLNLRKIQLALLMAIACFSPMVPVLAQPKPTTTSTPRPTVTPTPRSTTTPKPSGTSSEAPAKWANFRSPTGRFSADFPGKPQVQAKENKYYFFIASDGEKFCMLTYADTETSQDAQDFLPKTARSIVEGNKLTITQTKDISIQNNPGKDFKVKSNDGSSIAGNARAYLVGKRRYVLIELYKNPRDQDNKRFLDSFKLI
jgi:hypothetical protein